MESEIHVENDYVCNRARVVIRESDSYTIRYKIGLQFIPVKVMLPAEVFISFRQVSTWHIALLECDVGSVGNIRKFFNRFIVSLTFLISDILGQSRI